MSWVQYLVKKMEPSELLIPDQRFPSKTYLANEIREAVHNWRKEGYPGTSNTTKRLIQFWFKEDHFLEGEVFNFWFCQREAIETLIYIYEVMKKRNFIDMARDFGSGPIKGYDPALDQYPLYAFKMATGSGKTFVMVLAIIWSYFNRKYEGIEDSTSKFLLITPNVIVYDRLKRDFEDGKIFKKYPFIPPEWHDDFDLKVVLREDPIHVIPDEVLFLTNIQQLEEKKKQKEEVEEYVDDVLELEEVKKHDIYQENRIKEVITSCPNLMILKDEAHHIYNFEKTWKNILMNLHKELESAYGRGINSELDFSATPKTEAGAFFPWTIVDFPLGEAIEMNIVKRPMKGIVGGAEEVASKDAVERYRAWIDAGIRRWRDYKNKLKTLDKTPILFIMCEDTKSADEVYDYLNQNPDLRDRTLLIHTKLNGDILKKDLEKARKVARLIDIPESPELKELYPQGIGAIVSVMMLNEGWDVRNVNVIVGLRSFTSKRKVLPEQIIGRGLRKMFPEEVSNPEKGINSLEVIGPSGLVQLLEDLEHQEGVEFAEFDTNRDINFTSIFVDEDKLKKDIKIPIITPRIIIREFSLDSLYIGDIPALNIPLENKILETEYTAVDMLEGVEVVRETWDLPVTKDSKSVIAYYTDKILKQLKVGNFSSFHPIVKEYVKEKLFDRQIDLEDPRVLYNLSKPDVEKKIVDVFVDKFRDMTFKERKPEVGDYISLSDTRPFVWSKSVVPADKCIFNYVPCDNDFENDFAKFLDKDEDVESFSKVVPKVGFFIEYKDSEGSLKNYYPDFIVSTPHQKYIIETKGRRDVDVEHKDKRVILWCEDAERLTGEPWKFTRVDQKDFQEYNFTSLKELISAIEE